MPAIPKITRDFIQTLRSDVEQALEPLQDEYGLKVELGRCSYSTDAAEFKLTFSRVAADGNVLTPEARTFQVHAVRYGLVPQQLFQTFRDVDGVEYKVLGLKTRRSKYPIVCERTRDGKRFKMLAETVRAGLIRSATV